MKKILLPLLLMIFFVTGCGGEKHSENVTDTKSGRTITIGVDDEFAPICFHDEHNELVGFDVDLAKEAARRMAVEVKFKPIDWDNKREEITSGNIDLIWNGLDITDERKEYMIFTKPYMDDRQILVVKEDSDQDIESEIDLEGKVVGMQAGSVAETYLDQSEDLKNTFKECKIYGKFQEALDALKNGDIEVLVCDELVARYEINIHPDQFKIIDIKTGFITEMGVGFAKDNVELRDRIQKVFDEMIKDGTAKKISEKWFQADLIKTEM